MNQPFIFAFLYLIFKQYFWILSNIKTNAAKTIDTNYELSAKIV